MSIELKVEQIENIQGMIESIGEESDVPKKLGELRELFELIEATEGSIIFQGFLLTLHNEQTDEGMIDPEFPIAWMLLLKELIIDLEKFPDRDQHGNTVILLDTLYEFAETLISLLAVKNPTKQ